MGERISRESVAALSKKLEEWGTSLPENERALLDFLVSRGRALDPDRLRVERTREALSEAVVSVFTEIGQEWGKEGWAKIGPIWYKSGSLPTGEEVEITAKVELTQR